MLACKHTPHTLVHGSLIRNVSLCSVRKFWVGRLTDLDRFCELSKAFENDASNLQRHEYLKRKSQLKEAALGLLGSVGKASNESLVKTLQACMQVSNFCKVANLNVGLIVELLQRLCPLAGEVSGIQIGEDSKSLVSVGTRGEASLMSKGFDCETLVLISNATLKLGVDISNNLSLFLAAFNNSLPRLSNNGVLECYCNLGCIYKRIQLKCDVAGLDALMQKLFIQLCRSKHSFKSPRDIIRVARATNTREKLGRLHAGVLHVTVPISESAPTTREIYKAFKGQSHMLYTLAISGCLTTEVADAILENVWRFCWAYYMTTSRVYRPNILPQEYFASGILDSSVRELLYGKYKTKHVAAPSGRFCMRPTRPLHISKNVILLEASLQRMQLVGKTTLCRGLKFTNLYLHILHARLIPTLSIKSRQVLVALELFQLRQLRPHDTLEGEIVAQLESMGARPRTVSLQGGLFEPLVLYP